MKHIAQKLVLLAATISLVCAVLLTAPPHSHVNAQSSLQLRQYRGDGYSMSFPAAWWSADGNGAIRIKAGTGINAVIFDMQSRPGDTDVASSFQSYIANFVSTGGLGLPVDFSSTSRPTLYGAWRGDTYEGTGTSQGIPMIAAATFIRANGHIYVLQMLAASQNSWAAYQLRQALANTITFDQLPAASKGTGTSCSSCGAMLSDTMNRIAASSNVMY